MYASEKFRALMSGTRFRAFAAKFPKFRALDPIVTVTVTPGSGRTPGTVQKPESQTQSVRGTREVYWKGGAKNTGVVIRRSEWIFA